MKGRKTITQDLFVWPNPTSKRKLVFKKMQKINFGVPQESVLRPTLVHNILKRLVVQCMKLKISFADEYM